MNESNNSQNPDNEKIISLGSYLGASFFWFLSVAFLISSIVLSFIVSNKIDENKRESLLTHVKSMAHLLDYSKIDTLSGTLEDQEKGEYISLKETLVQLREINTDARFVYLMGSNGSKLFFYADSEDVLSEDYSPPGELYEDTTALQLSNYKNNVSFTEGPYSDKWGSWVSAYAPILNNENNTKAILGIDVDATLWQKELSFIRYSIISIGVLLSIILFFAGLYLRRSRHFLQTLGIAHEDLKRKNEELLGTVKQAHIAQWKLLPKTGDMSFDEEMYALTGIKSGTRVTIETFKDLMGEDDRKTFSNLLSTSIDKHSNEFTQKVSLRSIGNTIKVVKIVATLYYGGGEVPTVIHGTAQDITS